MPKFSIILPTYNRARLILRAVESVMRQTFFDFELIVIDDGSNDGTGEVLARVQDERLQYHWRKNAGRSSARNDGIDRARGAIITFLDSDDEALPGWLESFAKKFEDDSVSIVCCGAKAIVQESDLRNGSARILLPKTLGDVFENQQGLFLSGTFAVQRELLNAVGGYNLKMAYGENSELALRLLPACLQRKRKVAIILEPLVVFYNQRSFGSDSTFQERLQSAECLIEQHGQKYREKNRRAFASHCAIAAVNAARLGDYRKARHFIFMSIRTDPFRWKHYYRLFLLIIPSLGRKYWLRHANGSLGTDGRS